ncbi:MAG: polyprenyl synthetase family protein [Firmicutes bacterium]|nr:polyprenyl synthetase family protein [Bacillota bacterium]MDH7496091.1 polyprenyl synthetase family protein [Bacillota bacterium]
MSGLFELPSGMDERVRAVDSIIREALSCESARLSATRDHVLASRGKGLRPALVLLWAWATQDLGKTPDDVRCRAAIEVAAAAELIHMASLVHDDVIDGSKTRRGFHTVNAVFGARSAVLLGDFLFARAFSLLALHRDFGVVELMTDAIGAMCEGELEQEACAFSCDETEEGYLRRITLKTARLVAACCCAGAVIGGAAPEEVANAADYGLELGIAFQLTDDALDFVADEREIGKPTCQDLVCGVLTLPVLRLLSHESLGARARDIIESRQLDGESLLWVRSAVVECGGVDLAYERARESLERAAACASRLPAGPAREALTAITRRVFTRRR